jgi:xanthine/uracil/vitamin C permease (AzgA family)
MNASTKRTPDIYTEAVAGITTFFTMIYIVVVNPQILSTEGTHRTLFDGGPAQRHSSGDVRAGIRFNWLAGAGARKILIVDTFV